MKEPRPNTRCVSPDDAIRQAQMYGTGILLQRPPTSEAVRELVADCVRTIPKVAYKYVEPK